MPSAAVVDDTEYSPAELSAMRLDGDVFALAEALVPVDQPIDAPTRAAALLPAVRGADLVVTGRTAAWVHGVVETLERPYDLAVDVTGGRRGKRPLTAVREVRFGPGDLERLRGVRVTTPLRTAFDLLRGEDPDGGVTRSLLRLTRLDGPDVLAALSRLPGAPRKRAAIERARALLAGGVSPS